MQIEEKKARIRMRDILKKYINIKITLFNEFN